MILSTSDFDKVLKFCFSILLVLSTLKLERATKEPKAKVNFLTKSLRELLFCIILNLIVRI
ncbi:MAG: hypothetical protein COZ21_11745 [Bacteroidetes bacterium CG_4_10_14_3_um_filter_31_20]|nr:MAG: hypothetical protein A2X08_15565 [Bacteroidetes bacterium GWA2_32_17]PIY02905.1 MAG: hypothetical protein COZ21_11745 [Bacteroidetes bacterium CG_4_10_14_3_um_filter_31_20]